MARVRVLATTASDGGGLVPQTVYSAQIFEDRNDAEPVWVCLHEHRSTVAAQLCRVQFLTDRIVGRRKRGPT